MYRAGLGILVMWGVPSGYRFSYFAMNLQWHTISFGKAFIWPVVLALWLTRGRPESPWTVAGKKHGVPLVRRAEVAIQEEDKVISSGRQKQPELPQLPTSSKVATNPNNVPNSPEA